MNLEFPNTYPVLPGQTKVATIANISGATVVVTIINTLNGEFVQVGQDAAIETVIGQSEYVFDNIDFNSALSSLDNLIQIYA